MSTTTVRTALYDALKPLLIGKYSLRPNGTNLEQIAKPTVLVRLLTIQPTPERPLSSLTLGYTVTLASPKTSPQQAENDLDGDVFEILQRLDQIESVEWSQASKVTVSDKYLGYDITVSMLTNPPDQE